MTRLGREPHLAMSLCWVVPVQSMAIYIAILGLVPFIECFSFIVVLLLNIEGEFVPYIVGVTLVVQNFSEIFCIDFVGLSGSLCILKLYKSRTE